MPKPVRAASPSIDTILRAYCLACPYALAARTSDFKRCKETSIVGAMALRRMFKISAKALPCCLVGAKLNGTLPLYISTGLTAYDAYERLNKENPSSKSFEEWSQDADFNALEDKKPMHMVFQVQTATQRFIVDSTVGQLRELHNIAVPIASYFACEPRQKWPRYLTPDGWELQYDDSPHADALTDDLVTWQETDYFRNWLADLMAIMSVAVAHKANEKAFRHTLMLQYPTVFEAAEHRISNYLDRVHTDP